MEKQIKIAAKLYECRDTAKSLAKIRKEDYKTMLAPYTHIIKQVMEANKEEELPALIRISKTHTYNDNAMAQLMFMAATVELIEPSV